MVDVVFGSGDHGELAQSLRMSIQDLKLKGTLYFSYPIFGNSRVNGLTRADALLISQEHGVIVFDLVMSRRKGRHIEKWCNEIKNRQSKLRRNINALFCTMKNQPHQQESIIDTQVVTIIDSFPKKKISENITLATMETLHSVIKTNRPLKDIQVSALNSIIHGTTKLLPNNNRESAQCSGFYAYIFDEIDGNATCLDENQVQAALSCPQGPQRIRGLAGSGKTTVLALKAAHLHVANPDWNIAITYRNAALGPYIKSLIQRFMRGMKQGEPEWSKLHIFESFGRDEDFYENVIRHHGISIKEARSRSGDDPFDKIFRRGIKQLEKIHSRKKFYDAILIDDAQELPASFFRFAYEATRIPKRIVWASDELQSLIGYSSIPPENLFGSDRDGNPRVILKNREDQPVQDIVLGTCYRSTPQALTVAHALACGIHHKPKDKSDQPILQMYDDPKFWEDTGYWKVGGDLKYGKSVSLRRDPNRNVIRMIRSSTKKAQPNNTIYFKHFDSSIVQWNWITDRIFNDITNRQLLPNDILIIFPGLSAAYKERHYISERLEKKGILFDIIRPPMNRNQIFIRNSVKISNIFGAKEVEFPMVYFANVQECYDGPRPFKMRNQLYTGITRSSAWIRLCGVGKKGKLLEDEFRSVVKDKFNLIFDYPTQMKLENIKGYFSQRKASRTEIDRKISEFTDFVYMIENEELSINDLPSHLRRKLNLIFETRKK